MQAGVGEQLELEAQGANFAGRTRLGVLGRLVRRRGEVDVAFAAFAALRRDEALAGVREIDERRIVFGAFGVVDDRAGRDAHDDVLGAAAVLVAAFAGRAVVGFVGLLVAQVEQRRQLVVGDEDDAAAVAAVATRRSAAHDERLAAKRRLAVPAVAGTNINDALVDELHGNLVGDRRHKPPT